MAEIKLKDFVDEESFKKLVELDEKITSIKGTYAKAAEELAKGLTVEVRCKGDLDKLQNVYNAQMRNVSSASDSLTEALKKQSEVSEQLMKKIKEKAEAEKLSTKEVKELSKATVEASKAVQQAAKAEEAMNKAQKSANTTRKAATMTEEERIRTIKEALALADKQVHSIDEANEANKRLRQAVKMVRDTDDGYKNTLGKLNSTIGVNTDYVKRNSDRYSQQKMTIGNYREEIKAAWMEIERGNKSMKNMGIIASNVGNIFKTKVSSSIGQFKSDVGSMIKGFVGAQALISGFHKLTGLLKDGVRTAMDFEAANSNLAAILGTTSGKIKDLQRDARQLGATTKYTAAEATNLQVELAKLGFTVQEIKDSTTYVLRFAQATGAELSEAASLAGASLRMFGAETKETERYVSAMAVATSKSALSFSYLATAMPIVGPVAKSFNFTIEDTLALLGKLADAGFDASMAATATRNIMLNLADSSGNLAKALGKPVKDLPDLVNGLIKLRDSGVDLNTTLELTDKRSVAAFNAFLTAADKIIPLREQVTGVEEELQNMANTMSDNLSGSIKTLSSAWDEFMITLNGSNGILRGAVDLVTDLVRELNNLVTTTEEANAKDEAKARDAGNKQGAIDVQKNYDIINRNADNYVKQGMKREEAFKRAKEERMNIMRRTLKNEKENLDKSIAYNKKYNAELESKGYWGIGRSRGAIKNDITSSWNDRMQAESAYSSASTQLDLVQKYQDPQQKAETNKSGISIETDKEKKERLKVESDLQESRIALMKDGLDKELAVIRNGYQQKIDAIKGNSSTEVALRKSLQEEMNKALSDATEEYEKNRADADLQNRLAIAEEGSEEELAIRLEILEKQKEAEIKAAESNGADISLIEQKYLNEKRKLYEEYAADEVEEIAKSAAAQQVVRNAMYNSEIKEMEKAFAAGLISREEYERKKAEITEQYSIDTAKAAISSLEEQLAVEELSADDREAIAEKLQKAKADLANAEADAEIAAIERIKDKEEETYKKRIKKAQEWLSVSSDIIGTVGDLMSTMYEGDIENIEKQQEANEEAYNADVERIDAMVEQGVLSTEEGEARKRAAEAETAKKNEELENEKVKLQQKQAKWQKGVDIAQASISTALAITRALPNLVLAGIIAAMGAIQVATIAATPIPAYKEGTKNGGHIGGLAIVGDGGKQEVIVYGGKGWITPDTPTIVDLPKGAEVYPNIDTFDDVNLSLNPINDDKGGPVIVNDYSELSREMKAVRSELKKMSRIQHKDAYNAMYENYKRSRL